MSSWKRVLSSCDIFLSHHHVSQSLGTQQAIAAAKGTYKQGVLWKQGCCYIFFRAQLEQPALVSILVKTYPCSAVNFEGSMGLYEPGDASPEELQASSGLLLAKLSWEWYCLEGTAGEPRGVENWLDILLESEVLEVPEVFNLPFFLLFLCKKKR